jgi:hypothetical protein
MLQSWHLWRYRIKGSKLDLFGCNFVGNVLPIQLMRKSKMKKACILFTSLGLFSLVLFAPSASAVDCYKLPDSKSAKCQAYLKAAKKAGLVQTDTQEVPLAPAIAQRDAGRKVSETVKVPKAESKPSMMPTSSATPVSPVSPTAASTKAPSTKPTSKSSKKPKAKKSSKAKSKSKISPKPKAKKSAKNKAKKK